MEIILIGNYPTDKQESMERFALMLRAGFLKYGIQCSIWRPSVFFGSLFSSTHSGIGKWMGYVDKWILFSMVLIWRKSNKKFRSNKTFFHICDHSNAPYIQFLPADRASITCHDVLAIRGALGYADAYCPASRTGKLYQKWILHHLSKARKLAAVSQFTLDQLVDLQKNPDLSNKKWQVIHNGFNADFYPMDEKEALSLIKPFGIKAAHSFILHVGSDLSRKNRRMLLDMTFELGEDLKGQICFAGKKPSQELEAHASSLGLSDRLVSIIRPDHTTLVALYSTCQAFIFPSFSEGFGWPVIEAQACRAPVIASNIDPMPEVSGGAALHADPLKPKDFATAFNKLRDVLFKTQIVKEGMQNTKRFRPDLMIESYLHLLESEPVENKQHLCSSK